VPAIMWIRKAPHYTAGIAEGGSTFRTTDEVDKNKDSADWGPTSNPIDCSGSSREC